MKYAIISDIHGNIHAFKAVLADALQQGVDKFLLLGDYAASFPYGNDVVDLIKSLTPSITIRGNGEDYLINLLGCDPNQLTNEQFKPIYWAYRSLSLENMEFLSKLPQALTVTDGDTKIHLSHQMDLYFRTPQIDYFHSNNLRQMMKTTTLSHEEYLAKARAALLACPEALAEIEGMSKGVYLCGHNHLQFYMECDGKLFINPGSCGEPLDRDTRAPYTILTLNKTGWQVNERRVVYDLDAVNEGLKSSGYAAYAPVWAKIMELELCTAKDYFMAFVLHVEESAKKLGSTEFPANDEVWKFAVSTWDASRV